MTQVISLDEYRERRNRQPTALSRLDAAVIRLDFLVRGQAGRLTLTIERELLRISRAVAAGYPSDAAERAERLAGMLEHPLASG